MSLRDKLAEAQIAARAAQINFESINIEIRAEHARESWTHGDVMTLVSVADFQIANDPRVVEARKRRQFAEDAVDLAFAEVQNGWDRRVDAQTAAIGRIAASLEARQ